MTVFGAEAPAAGEGSGVQNVYGRRTGAVRPDPRGGSVWLRLLLVLWWQERGWGRSLLGRCDEGWHRLCSPQNGEEHAFLSDPVASSGSLLVGSQLGRWLLAVSGGCCVRFAIQPYRPGGGLVCCPRTMALSDQVWPSGGP